MGLLKRDEIATGLVVAAGVVYLLWAAGSTVPGLSSTRASGIVILALGFAASASAVVPTFDQLLHGNKAYLAVTSLIGVGAFAAGVVMLVTASDAALSVLMAAMVLLWLIATIHHARLAPATSASPVRGRRQTPGHPTHGLSTR